MSFVSAWARGANKRLPVSTTTAIDDFTWKLSHPAAYSGGGSGDSLAYGLDCHVANGVYRSNMCVRGSFSVNF